MKQRRNFNSLKINKENKLFIEMKKASKKSKVFINILESKKSKVFINTLESKVFLMKNGLIQKLMVICVNMKIKIKNN